MDIGFLYSAGLLGELKSFSVGYSQTLLNRRILRIYIMCMRNGHPITAQRLADKYPEVIKIKSDVVLAFGWALQAHQQLNKDNGNSITTD